MRQRRSNGNLTDEIPDFGFYGIDVRHSELSQQSSPVSGNRGRSTILAEHKKPGDDAECI